jgi:uncharacterized membrane protein YfcA
VDFAGALSPEVAIVLVAAFAAGFIDSMVGGGGLIQLPALFGVYPATQPAILLGTSKVAGTFGTLSAVVRFARSVHIPWRALLPSMALIIGCSLAGAFIASRVPPEIFRPLVPVALTAVLIYLLRNRDLGLHHSPRVLRRDSHALAIALIAAIGFYDGFFGPGTGSFLMIVYMRLFGFDFLHSAACARVLNACANGAALLCFGVLGAVMWPLGAAMAVCSITGAILGTRLAIRRGSRFMRHVFLGVVGALIAKTAWDAVQNWLQVN